MTFLSFLRGNAPWLAAGGLMSLSTGFGQTFFISLYATELRAEFNLSHGDWGVIYMVATLTSAVALTFAGRLNDRFRARSMALIILLAFALICVGMWAVNSALMLGVLILGLRFCGQGMLGHISMTAMGKWFRATRARAIAIASLGYSAGEAVLPTIALSAIALVGWRQSWLLAAAFLVFIAAPLLLWLLRNERSPQATVEAVSSPGMGGRHWTSGDMMRHWMFWALLPGIVAPAWVGTVIFFQIRELTDAKGWEIISYAALAYPAYSITTVVSSFVFGWAADRFGAVRLLPFYLLGWAGAVFLLSAADSLFMGAMAMMIGGVASGGVSIVTGALFAEVYGTRWLGGVRAIAVAMMVLGSAVGPGVSGALLDAGVGIIEQLYGMGGAILIVSLWFLPVGRLALRLLDRSETDLEQ
ncbi:MAG: MFS transporter [Pikeienuella sp.]